MAIAVLAAACVLVFWMLRRRKRRQHLPENYQNVPGLGQYHLPWQVTYKENHAYELNLMPTVQRQSERVDRHEVSGGFEGHEMSNETAR